MIVKLSASDTSVDIETLLNSFKLAAQFDFDGFIKELESQSTMQDIQDGEAALNLALKIAGVFFPPVAVVANDISVAEAIVNFVGPIIFAAIKAQQNSTTPQQEFTTFIDVKPNVND